MFISKRAYCYFDGIMSFGYKYENTIKDIEEFNINDYKKMISKLDFSNYIFVYQSKK